MTQHCIMVTVTYKPGMIGYHLACIVMIFFLHNIFHKLVYYQPL